MQYETVIQQELINRIKEVSASYHFEDGINPLGLYCSHTGRMMATMTDDEIGLILSANRVTEYDPQTTLDLFIDLALLSARPSPAWLYQSKDNMKALLNSDPVGAAVKYLSIAVEHEWRYKKKQNSKSGIGYLKHGFASLESRMDWQRMLIQLFTELQSEDMKVTKELILVLIMADSEIGLQKIKPVKSNPLVEILNMGTFYNIGAKHWQVWIKHYKSALTRHQAKPIARQKEGNSRSRSQFHHYNTLHRPPSKAQLKKEAAAAKNKKVDDIFANLLDLCDGSLSVTDTLASRYDASKTVMTHTGTGSIAALSTHRQNASKLQFKLI